MAKGRHSSEKILCNLSDQEGNEHIYRRKEEKKQSWMEPAISPDGGDDALKTQMVRLEYC